MIAVVLTVGGFIAINLVAMFLAHVVLDAFRL